MTKTVLIVDAFADVYRETLCDGFPELQIHASNSLAEIQVDLSDIDALISFGNDLTDDVFRDATKLKWVQSLATGVDQFLRHPSFRPETTLTSARGIHAAPMRETVALLMLSVSRNVKRLVRNQDAKQWDRGEPWPILSGKTAVIVGIGVSGLGIGELLKSFGMRVVGISRTPRQLDAFDEIFHPDEIAAVAGDADYLINVLPGGKANTGAIGRPVLSALKPTSIFINVGRGETVDEEALIDLLQSDSIAGAGLDVVSTRNLPETSPLWTLPNVFLSPHIGAFFAEYEEHVMPIVEENMRAFISGRIQDMLNVVER